MLDFQNQSTSGGIHLTYIRWDTRAESHTAFRRRVYKGAHRGVISCKSALDKETSEGGTDTSSRESHYRSKERNVIISMLLYKPIRCTQDLVDLQSDTDKIGQWTRENFLTLNSSKCKTMLITRKKQCSLSNQFYITLYSESLDRVYLFKYLV